MVGVVYFALRAEQQPRRTEAAALQQSQCKRRSVGAERSWVWAVRLAVARNARRAAGAARATRGTLPLLPSAASARTWTAASKWRPRITACRRAGSAAASWCSGIPYTSGCSTRALGSYSESAYASVAAAIGSKQKTGRAERHIQSEPPQTSLQTM